MIKNYIFNSLKKKIKSKTITVGVIGLGYVGLPLVYAFLKKNIKVIGFDNDIEKIKKIRLGLSYINYFSNMIFCVSIKVSFANFTK